MNVAFHLNQLCIRGTTKSVFQYAKYNKELLFNNSFILYNKNSIYNNDSKIQEFKNVFGDYNVICYSNPSEIYSIVIRNRIDVFYAQKAGFNDGIVAPCKTCVHAVFDYPIQQHKHGDVYAYISQWLSEKNKNAPFVPYIVPTPPLYNNYGGLNYRKKLNIPPDALVFGRHGGLDTFDIQYVKDYISDNQPYFEKNNVYFVFMNTPKFTSGKNIKFLPSYTNDIHIDNFIGMCDVMIHSRSGGETFGLACAEFAIRGKPVLTNSCGKDKEHIRNLSKTSKIFIYNSFECLRKIIDDLIFHRQLIPTSEEMKYCYSEYNPECVMKKFKEVFLDD